MNYLNKINNLSLGPHPVFWLPYSLEIPEKILLSKITDHEQIESQEIKAKLKQEEYLRSRWLIHEILGTSFSLKKSPAGDPIWPENIRASLSHKEGEIVFAWEPSEKCAGLGVDIEKPDRLHPGIEDKIINQRESCLLAACQSEKTWDSWEKNDFLCLFFSFKESVYKCFCPIFKKRFMFLDVEITKIEAESSRITAVFTEEMKEYSEVKIVGHFYRPANERDFIITGVFSSRK